MKRTINIIAFVLICFGVNAQDYPASVNINQEMYVSDLFDSCSRLKIDTVTLLAMLLNSEARIGHNGKKWVYLCDKEVKDIASTLYNRKRDCYMGGRNIVEQMFIPAQFSGVVKRNENGERWSSYFDTCYRNDNQLGEHFYFNRDDKRCRKLYDLAKIVYDGDYRTNIKYFLNPVISTDSLQVAKVEQNRIARGENYIHLFAENLN